MLFRSFLVVLLGLVSSCRFPGYAVSNADEPLEQAGASGAGAGSGASGGGAGGAGAASSGSGFAGLAGEGGDGGERTNANADEGAGGGPGVPDECPDDPDKVAPGECGCGIPDVATTALADCRGLEQALIHRYDFEGTGTQVTDRVGSAHGVIARGSTLSKLDGKGVVLLGGGDQGTYVDLPNQLVSVLSNATLEAWVTWGGGNPWQRIFDFGDTTHENPENQVGTGKSYLFLTPVSNDSMVEVTFSSNGSGSPDHISVAAGPPLSQVLSQLVVVANSSDDELVLYVDGERRSQAAWTGELSLLNDVNNWLGRSQWGNDPELNAIFHDFRIYDQALSDAQVAASFVGGPDPTFLAD